ncbi:high mobility group nucleosome-binding domain-containing protein 5 isoform X2 [Eurosta solidaginis]|uniref:high mobility group nucleosome-binding domain-containing protein 5 isoform X2 n=1 Tax=Eurosta solidaginis TaxID=178769 RepID=UPI003530BD10
MVLKVYISGMSGNKEVKKRQQRVLMILDSKNIKYDIVDITEPGKESEKELMQTKSTSNGATVSDPEPRHPLPPQIFNEEDYCGDYDAFDLANEIDTLEQFLKLAPADTTAVSSAQLELKQENGEVKGAGGESDENKENKENAEKKKDSEENDHAIADTDDTANGDGEDAKKSAESDINEEQKNDIQENFQKSDIDAEGENVEGESMKDKENESKVVNEKDVTEGIESNKEHENVNEVTTHEADQTQQTVETKDKPEENTVAIDSRKMQTGAVKGDNEAKAEETCEGHTPDGGKCESNQEENKDPKKCEGETSLTGQESENAEEKTSDSKKNYVEENEVNNEAEGKNINKAESVEELGEDNTEKSSETKKSENIGGEVIKNKEDNINTETFKADQTHRKIENDDKDDMEKESGNAEGSVKQTADGSEIAEEKVVGEEVKDDEKAEEVSADESETAEKKEEENEKNIDVGKTTALDNENVEKQTVQAGGKRGIPEDKRTEEDNQKEINEDYKVEEYKKETSDSSEIADGKSKKEGEEADAP